MHDRERDREVSLQSIALSSHGISISRLSISSITSLGGLQPNYNIIVVARNELGIGGVSIVVQRAEPGPTRHGPDLARHDPARHD